MVTNFHIRPIPFPVTNCLWGYAYLVRDLSLREVVVEPRTGPRLPIEGSLAQGLGYVLERGHRIAAPGTGVFVLLQRAPNSPLGYIIRTAYPIVK